ncbi:MAG: GTPase [candidate division Zixibacteria bacterium]|nr:GTPase [candidate division Zixibacteria bacterium]
MIIRSFTADTASAALKEVRKAMGSDAIVLKTRQSTDPISGSCVEITACLEKPSVAQSSATLCDRNQGETSVAKIPSGSRQVPTPDIESAEVTGDADLHRRIVELDRKLDRLVIPGSALQTASDIPDQLQKIHNRLSDADLSKQAISMAIGRAMTGKEEATTKQALVEHLANVTEPNLNFQAGDRILFAGPPGAGKSSAMGKLAAQLVVREKKKIALVTLDNQKIAAWDELCSYSEILGADVVDPMESTEKNASASDQITLIDTPALPTDEDKLRTLLDKIDRIKPNVRFAVFSTLIRSSDALMFSEQMEVLAPTHLIMTMLDLTNRYGSVITVAEKTGLKISFATDAPGGIGDIKTPDPDLLARSLLGMEVSLG